MKLRLKKEVKGFLLGLVLGTVLVNIISNLNTVGLDELGNTCYGGIIKVCGGE